MSAVVEEKCPYLLRRVRAPTRKERKKRKGRCTVGEGEGPKKIYALGTGKRVLFFLLALKWVLARRRDCFSQAGRRQDVGRSEKAWGSVFWDFTQETRNSHRGGELR